MTTLADISLLAPGMLTGGLLIGLPILAHLMHRRARRRVVFPSIDLLKSAAASRSALFRFRRWWLLLLRCLAVLAVALAFAQPVWLSAFSQRARGQGAAVVIVLDVSASARQLYNGVSAMQPMRADAERVIDALTPGGDYANIVYATARPYAAFPAITANTDALRAELADLKPTNDRADLTAALSLASQMLLERAGPKQLVIVTDLQASNWVEALKRLEHDESIPPDTNVTILPPKHAPPGNLSLHTPGVYPHAPRVGEPANLTATLANYGELPKSVTVRVSIDGRSTASRSLTVDPSRPIEVSFAHTFDHPGEHRVVFTLPADGLTVDDACYLVARVVDRTPVAVITDDDADRPGTAGYYLVRALAPYGDERDRYEVTRIHGTQPEWPALNHAHAVFVGEVGTLSPDRLALLHQYMEQGGGVVYFCGDGPVVKHLLGLDALAPGGLLPWKPTAQRVVSGSDDALTITSGDWRSALLSRFDETAQLALPQIRFHRAWAGEMVEDRAQVLLRYADGTPALVQCGVGGGTLALANFSVTGDNSELGKHGLFVALMQGLADQMRQSNTVNQESLVGHTVNLTTAATIDLQGQTLRVFQPDGVTPTEAIPILHGQTSGIAIRQPDEPGFYTAEQGDTLLGTAAINIDPRESDLRRIAADELISALRSNAPGAQVRDTSAGAPLELRGRDLWGWLFVLAFVFLGLEMTLLGWWRR